MRDTTAEVLFAPAEEGLRYLPEGPCPIGDGRLGWVAIQHGPEATTGSLNVLDLVTGDNATHALDGRPGFAFPTTRDGALVIGIERQLRILDLATGDSEPLGTEAIDADVEGTIINDGVVCADGLVFGCKELTFTKAVAGLYLWRSADGRLFRLRDDQTCSNGKVMRRRAEGGWELLDIDTPTKQVVRYTLDVERGELSAPETVLDLRDEPTFPDGMVATPDGASVIIAVFDPRDREAGEARQYALATGQVEAIWRTPGSPQVTCPQLVSVPGAGVKLVLTTAAENMAPARRARHPNAGALFVATTPFETAPETPRLRLPPAWR